jgi:hypothetical protein
VLKLKLALKPITEGEMQQLKFETNSDGTTQFPSLITKEFVPASIATIHADTSDTDIRQEEFEDMFCWTGLAGEDNETIATVQDNQHSVTDSLPAAPTTDDNTSTLRRSDRLRHATANKATVRTIDNPTLTDAMTQDWEHRWRAVVKKELGAMIPVHHELDAKKNGGSSPIRYSVGGLVIADGVRLNSKVHTRRDLEERQV